MGELRRRLQGTEGGAEAAEATRHLFAAARAQAAAEAAAEAEAEARAAAEAAEAAAEAEGGRFVARSAAMSRDRAGL